MKILLVNPKFPIPTKSKNHKNFLPIGLLKIGGYYKSKNHVERVELVHGNTEIDFKPDRIFITSLFTYWSEYFWKSVEYYRKKFPNATIQVGGIYVSLFYEEPVFKQKCRYFKVKPHKGVLKYAEEKNKPDFSLLSENPHSIDYQILHTSRGCIRSCEFCGTWIIEPKFISKQSIKDEIVFKKLVFYDNNLLANPYIEKILDELIELKKDGTIRWCESQSGFDGRILEKYPHLARKLKKAGFRYPRIAWDWAYKDWPNIEKQIEILKNAGYNSKEIYIFMVYNWKWDFEEMERKRIKCYEWGIQISDCRYRPLDQEHDNYKPLKDQNNTKEYYINHNWSDAEVKQFRKNVRRQNICLRHDFEFHSKILENKKFYTKKQYQSLKNMPLQKAKTYLPDLWTPNKITPPPDREKWYVKKLNHQKIKSRIKKLS